MKFHLKLESFHSQKYFQKCRLPNVGHFISALTCLGRNKVATISKTTLKSIFVNENLHILTKISLKFVAKGSYKKSVLLHEMGRHRRDGKLLPE